MEANKNLFDEHFRRRLSDHESPVPDDLFDRLQARRGGSVPSDAPVRERLEGHESPVPKKIFDAVVAERERQKRRRILLWRSVAAIAALWVFGSFLFEWKNKNTLAHNEETASKTVPKVGNSELKIKNSTLEMVQNNENTEGSNSELKTKNSSAGNEAIASQDNKTIINNENTEGATTGLKNKNRSDNDVPKQQIITVKKVDADPKSSINSKEKFTKIYSNNTNAIINSINELGIKILNSELKNVKGVADKENIERSNFELKNEKDSTNKENTEGSSSELNNKNKVLETALENHFSPPNFQVSVPDFLTILDVKTRALTVVKKHNNPCADPGNGCPTFGGRRGGMRGNTFYVDAFGAPEYAVRSLKTNLVESEKRLAARDSTEKTQYAVSAGARVSLVFTNGVAVRAGLVFNQINERAQFDSLGVGSIKTTYDVRIVNGQPDTVSVTTVITDGIFRKIRHNHYRSIDIPLQIGYEKAWKNGWAFSLNGGINVNIKAWQKADIVGVDLQKQTVSSGLNEGNPVFRTKLGISVIGSVAAYRRLTNKLQFIIEPSVRYGLQPITRTDYALKQQYVTAGIMVGLRLRL